MEALEKAIPLVVKPARDVITNPSGKAEKEKLVSGVSTVKTAHQVLSKHGQTRKVDKEKLEKERIRKGTVFVFHF